MPKRAFTLFVWVVLFLSNSAFCEGGLHLRLSRSDVEKAVVSNGELWLKLSPDASLELSRITEDNVGKTLSISLEDTPLLEMRIHAGVDSGVINIQKPSSPLIGVFGTEKGDQAPD